MKKIGFIGALMASFSTFALETADEKAIQQILEHFTKAWNEHLGHGSADFYAQDADFVNIFGMAFSGKEEIEKRHIKIHETFLKNSHYEVINLRLRELKPDVVLAQESWEVTQVDPSMQGIFTHVLVKNNGQWHIESSQNTLIKNSK